MVAKFCQITHPSSENLLPWQPAARAPMGASWRLLDWPRGGLSPRPPPPLIQISLAANGRAVQWEGGHLAPTGGSIYECGLAGVGRGVRASRDCTIWDKERSIEERRSFPSTKGRDRRPEAWGDVGSNRFILGAERGEGDGGEGGRRGS